jgi:predicted phosphodiesterase
MKAWIVSDLHMELGQPFDAAVPAGADVMICAGDILDKGIVPTLEWLASKYAPHLPVVVVAGNHEYYRAALTPSIEEARVVAAAASGRPLPGK